MRRWATVAAMIGLAWAGPSAAAPDEDRHAPEPDDAAPPVQAASVDPRVTPIHLRGHDFILPARLDHPFVVRQFALRQGVGYVAVPGVTVEGYDAPFTLALAGVVETLRVDGAILPWLGLYGELGGQLSAGVNADSAFFEGARGGVAWKAGAVARLVRDPARRIQVGTRVFVSGDHGFGLQPGTLVAAVVEDREGTLAEVLDGQLLRYLLTRDLALISGASLSAAVPLSERVGLIASARSAGGSKRLVRFDGEDDLVTRLPIATVSAGVAVDVDLAPLPLQLQVEGRARHEAELGRERTLEGPLGTNVFGGIGAFWGGRRDVQLGLKLASLIRLGPDVGERWAFGELVIRVFL